MSSPSIEFHKIWIDQCDATEGIRGQFGLEPPDPDLEIDDLDDNIEDNPWPENPVMGAEELLRFSRVRQLLQP